MNNKDIAKYPVYKGLKKPFVFKGYIGKYIYMAGGGLIVSLIVGAVLTSFSIIIGLIAMGGGFVGTILIVSHLQKTKGLFNKNRHHNVLWVHKNQIKSSKKE